MKKLTKWELRPCCDECEAGLLSVDKSEGVLSDDRGNWVRADDVEGLYERIADLERQLAEAHEVLAECREYFYERADAEYFTDSPEPVGNEEMTLLCMIEDVAIGRSATAPESAGSPESPKE